MDEIITVICSKQELIFFFHTSNLITHLSLLLYNKSTSVIISLIVLGPCPLKLALAKKNKKNKKNDFIMIYSVGTKQAVCGLW